jgi:hypothetical protein
MSYKHTQKKHQQRAPLIRKQKKKAFVMNALIIICNASNHKLLANAEVGEDIVQDRVTCDVGSRDFADGCDSTTQVGRQQICGEAIRQPRTHSP